MCGTASIGFSYAQRRRPVLSTGDLLWRIKRCRITIMEKRRACRESRRDWWEHLCAITARILSHVIKLISSHYGVACAYIETMIQTEWIRMNGAPGSLMITWRSDPERTPVIRNERVRKDNTRSKAARTGDVLSVLYNNHFRIRFLAFYDVDVASGLNKVKQTNNRMAT